MTSSPGCHRAPTSGAELPYPYNMGSQGLVTAPHTGSAFAGGTWQQQEHLQASQAESASVAGSDCSGHTAYTPSSRALPHISSFRSAHNQTPPSHPPAYQEGVPGLQAYPYDTSPDNSSQADSTDQQYMPQMQYYHNHQGGRYASNATAPDELSQLRAELAKRKRRIAELQHEVDTADSHRRHVQAHNFDLQGQITQMQQLLQGYPGGYQLGVDAVQMHQITSENAGLKFQLAQLSQQLYHDSLVESQNPRLLELQGTVSQLRAQLAAPPSTQQSAEPGDHEAELAKLKEELSSTKSQLEVQLLELKTQHKASVDQLEERIKELMGREEALAQEHRQKLSRLEADKEQQLAELSSKHADLTHQHTQQTEQLQADMRAAQDANKATINTRESDHDVLTKQKQQLEADLQEAQSANEVIEQRLVEAELGLVEAEENLDETKQKLKQSEQQAHKAAKTIRAQEKQISQLNDQTATSREEIEYLKGSLKELTDENSRLIRESKLARERFANKQQEVRELQDRLVDCALQAPDGGTGDAFSGPAAASIQDRGARGGTDMDAKQEAVIAELEEVQRATSRTTSPVTLASVAKERLHQVNLGVRSASPSSASSIDTDAAADVVIPRIDFPRPKSFKPRAHTRRHSSDLDNPARPRIVASPAVSLPQPDSLVPLSQF